MRENLKLIKELQLYEGKEVVKKEEAKTKSIMSNFWNKGYCRQGDACLFDCYDCYEHLQSGRGRDRGQGANTGKVGNVQKETNVHFFTANNYM